MRQLEFEGQLEEDLGWRKKEISNLMLIGKSAKDPTVIFKSLILLLYSHWEGYIKNSSKLYLTYVSNKGLTIDTLSDNFKAIVLKNIIRDCYASNDGINLKNEIKVLEKLTKSNKLKFRFIVPNLEDDTEIFQERSKLADNIINTHSNLNPKIFKNILEILGLSYKTQLKSKEKYIELHLLKNRNLIAHGNKLIFEESSDFNLRIEELEKLRDIVFSIIDNFKDELIEYSKEQYFLDAKKELVKEFLLMKDAELQKTFETIDSKYN